MVETSFPRDLAKVTYTYYTMVEKCQTAPLLRMVLFMLSLDLLEVKEVSYIQTYFFPRYCHFTCI
jgi:hypothetical protein